MKKLKKYLTAFLCAALVFSLVPAAAFAADDDADGETEETTTETPYANDTENSSLPDAPTKSGSTWYVDANNVQYALDGAYGSINGVTLVLESGTYDTLYIGRPTKYSGSGTNYYNMTWSGSVWKVDTESQKVDSISDLTNNVQYYYRTISNVTITAEDDVTVSGISISAGIVTASSNEYNYVLDKSGTTYYYGYSIKNLTFKGLNISGTCSIGTTSKPTGGLTSSIDDLTFDSCTFTGDTSSMGTNTFTAIRSLCSSLSDVTITNCTIKDYYQGIYLNGTSGTTTIKNNYICNTTHNAIALQSGSDGTNTISGTYVIEENLIHKAGNRAIRFGNASGAKSITVKNNVILNSGDSDDENFKADSLPSDTSAVLLEYNYWDGEEASTAVANEGYVPTTNTVEDGVWDEDVIEVIEPTCTKKGYTLYTCTVCETSYKRDYVDANGHTAGDAVIENEVAATCTEAGSYDSVVYCTVCNTELSRETITVAATGHDWDDGTAVWADDYSSVTVTWVCQNDSSHTYTATDYVITSEEDGDGGTTYTVTCTDPNGDPYTSDITVEAENEAETEAETETETEAESSDSTSPTTGDSGILLWIIIFGAALVLALALSRKLIRR